MSRRTHKKSRHGCTECKRRHMRCDESRPRCLNCEKAELHCSFDNSSEPQFVFYDGQTQGTAPLSGNSAQSTPATNTPARRRSSDTGVANTAHFILTQNLSSLEINSFDISEVSMIIPMSMYARYAESSPYLLHQVLAASALHLSVVAHTQQERQSYYQQASDLHTRALLLFNQDSTVASLNQTTCVQAYLYSCLLGVYMLCESLHYHTSSLPDFLESFTRCLLIYRGVPLILNETKDLLQDTEVGPQIRSVQEALGSTEVRGQECRDIWDMLESSSLPQGSLDACRSITERLEQIFRAQRRLSLHGSAVPYVLFAWPGLVSQEFIDLLKRAQPEALVIIAHFAAILHQGQHLWFFGRGGRLLIEHIATWLGPAWLKWLKTPLHMLTMM